MPLISPDAATLILCCFFGLLGLRAGVALGRFLQRREDTQ